MRQNEPDHPTNVELKLTNPARDKCSRFFATRLCAALVIEIFVALWLGTLCFAPYEIPAFPTAVEVARAEFPVWPHPLLAVTAARLTRHAFALRDLDIKTPRIHHVFRDGEQPMRNFAGWLAAFMLASAIVHWLKELLAYMFKDRKIPDWARHASFALYVTILAAPIIYYGQAFKTLVS